jgi:hypothetical protein
MTLKYVEVTGLEGVEWIDLAENKDGWWGVLNTVVIHRDSYNAGNFLTCSGSVKFSRRILVHCGVIYNSC